jgi:CubicO group peptidase (beta-lactamase class C family)
MQIRFVVERWLLIKRMKNHKISSRKKMHEVDQFLSAYVVQHKTPSIQYLLFHQDAVIYRLKDGFANIGKQIPTDWKTTYCGFSATKPFTATAILQLAEQEKLDIDHLAREYLPDFPYSTDITIRHLLSHSAGIPNPIPLRWVHLHEEHSTFDRNTFFNEVFQKKYKVISNPNDKFSYSNLGYMLLGQIIEEVSGLPYEEYIQQHIFKLLELEKNELDFIIPDTHYHAIGYQKRFSFMNLMLGFMMNKKKYMDHVEGKWVSFKTMYPNGAPYGGLIGTSIAFMKYIQDLLKPESRLLSKKYKQLMFTEALTNKHKKTGMCLSWFKGKLKGMEYFAHAGGGGGYYCEIRIYPKSDLGSVVFMNRTGMTDARFLDRVDGFHVS